MQFECAHCTNLADRPAGHVNRARAQGNKLFCSRECFGLDRRQWKPVEQRKEEKRLYDADYRKREGDALKAKKAEYYQRTKDPAKEAVKRKERMPLHVEYCRRPEYRAKKKVYDREYRAEKEYGAFAECFLLVMDIRDECLSRMTDYEIRLEKGTLNKSLQRKRNHERSIRNSPEVGPLGHLERGERGQNGRLSRGCYRLPGSGNPSHHEHAVADLAAVEAASCGGRDQIL